MAFQRGDHRLVGLIIDLGKDPTEVADWLMVMEGEREGDPGRHRRQPASVMTGSGMDTATSTPAAGR